MPIATRIAAAAVLAALVSLGCTAHADQTTDKLKSTLEARIPDIHIKSIAKAPIAGLYEVNVGTQMIYTDSNGDYVIAGDLLNTKTRTNVSEAHLAELNKVDFAGLPLDRAVKVVKGNGSRRIAVFSDPNCPYCKQLETTLKSIDNVTVYTFLYPVLSPDSVAKSKAIWCSSDRAKSWESWMVDHQPPASVASNCDTSAVDKNLALGHDLNVTGTPTIILSDGRRLPGAVSASELNDALASAH